MQDFAIPLPLNVEPALVQQAIDAAVIAADLRTTLRGSLRKYPGCVHWHLKNGTESGTLEVTFWPQERRAWFTIQKGRRAAWIREKLALVGELVQQHLNQNL